MDFIDKLEAIKDAIVAEANGVTCRTCHFAMFYCGKIGYCKHSENTHVIHGGPITISHWAPKCRKYKKTKRTKKSKEFVMKPEIKEMLKDVHVKDMGGTKKELAGKGPVPIQKTTKPKKKTKKAKKE